MLTNIGRNNLLPILNDLVAEGQIERCARRGREVLHAVKAR